jgi:hypothetical protein
MSVLSRLDFIGEYLMSVRVFGDRKRRNSLPAPDVSAPSPPNTGEYALQYRTMFSGMIRGIRCMKALRLSRYGDGAMCIGSAFSGPIGTQNRHGGKGWREALSSFELSWPLRILISSDALARVCQLLVCAAKFIHNRSATALLGHP